VKQFLRLTPVPLAILLIIGLRLIDLRSDPFPRLDFSAGLMTDEGFYIHNARNLILFGHARTNEFNNMLISPLLHFGHIIMDDRWKERYWMVCYLELVTPERRIKLARVLNWKVGVYPVKP
jgi:hypothetical protein